jgi:hypothetical protein
MTDANKSDISLTTVTGPLGPDSCSRDGFSVSHTSSSSYPSLWSADSLGSGDFGL